MTRTIRGRRVESVHQPLYARMLRLRHLAPSGLLCFVFLEGAVVLGILLALAELVSWWGVVVLPVTVALMVKFNDLVAGAIAPRPVAAENTPGRTAVLRPAAMVVPGEEDGPGVVRPPGAGGDAGFGSAGAAFTRVPGGPTPSGDWSAVYGPASASADQPGVYGSVFADRPAGQRRVSEDRSGVYGASSGERAGGYGGSSEARPGVSGHVPGGHGQVADDRAGVYGQVGDERAGVHGWFADERAGGYDAGRAGEFTPRAAPVTGGFTPAAMPVGGGHAPIVSPESAMLGYEPDPSTDGMAGVPAVGYPGSYSRGVAGSGSTPSGSTPSGSTPSGSTPSGSTPSGSTPSGSTPNASSSSGSSPTAPSPGAGGVSAGGHGDEGQHQVRSTVESSVEASRGNHAPIRRAWTDERDVRQQMARQAASRRYE